MDRRPAPGTRVLHASYGKGTVVTPTSHTHQDYAAVVFDRSKSGKPIRLPFRALHKTEG